MTERAHPLDYARDPDPTVERRWRRIVYCVALPVMAFGLAGGFGHDALLNGGIAAAGALLLAIVIPVRF